jgi:cytidylate kinase
MHYRLLTVNREFGSGGGRIAQTIAKSLGWKLLDKDIIDAIAYRPTSMSEVHRYDEHVESWLRRINQQAMRSAALAAGLELRENSLFDAEEMVRISQNIIQQAYHDGNCVIVGRGSQCVLQHKPDAFHVFVYAPHRERILRLRQRLPEGRRRREAHSHHRWRARPIPSANWGKYWLNPHLYDLMISSQDGEDQTARIIQSAMTGVQDEMLTSK